MDIYWSQGYTQDQKHREMGSEQNNRKLKTPTNPEVMAENTANAGTKREMIGDTQVNEKEREPHKMTYHTTYK